MAAIPALLPWGGPCIRLTPLLSVDYGGRSNDRGRIGPRGAIPRMRAEGATIWRQPGVSQIPGGRRSQESVRCHLPPIEPQQCENGRLIYHPSSSAISSIQCLAAGPARPGSWVKPQQRSPRVASQQATWYQRPAAVNAIRSHVRAIPANRVLGSTCARQRIRSDYVGKPASSERHPDGGRRLAGTAEARSLVNIPAESCRARAPRWFIERARRHSTPRSATRS